MIFRKKAIKELSEENNLNRAWRWIKSNPDARYKKYFRELYSDYFLIEDSVIKDISINIKNNTYEPSHSCKIFIPKSSGILRSYTLLTVEDQIVYQAMVNVIAERLYPKVSRNYYVENFGNLYAGKKCGWFYRKWSDGYRRFNEAAKKSFEDGLIFTASFDLTACYDSIDHKVLGHFLREIGCDAEFIRLLATCLSKWTGNESSQIYHDHGIPQGPLSSGLLSEVVLKYFDINYGNRPSMRYMRYVDDIHLFADSEKSLRKMLVRLDRLSKDIGLFPQSGKIEIHEVKNIDDELKSISNPSESSIKGLAVNQTKLQKRIVELTKGYKISNQTRFKYVLAHARPSSKINERLLRLFKKYPANFESILRYFQRYKFIPSTVVNFIVNEIESNPIYTTIIAALFETLDGRIRPNQKILFNRLVKSRWLPKSLESEVALHVALGRIMIREGLINTPAKWKFAFNSGKEWYVKSSLIHSLNSGTISPNILSEIINSKIQDKSNDVACSAAVVMVKYEINLSVHSKTINLRAASILKEFGVIGRMPNGSRQCFISIYMNKWLDGQVSVNWRLVFGVDYKEARNKAFNCCRVAGMDITAWVNYMDVFNDLLLKALFQHDTSIGKYSFGQIGSCTDAGEKSKFRIKYPCIFAMVKSIHEKRRGNELSHSIDIKTKKASGPVKYSYYAKDGKPLIKSAFQELADKW